MLCDLRCKDIDVNCRLQDEFPEVEERPAVLVALQLLQSALLDGNKNEVRVMRDRLEVLS